LNFSSVILHNEEKCLNSAEFFSELPGVLLLFCFVVYLIYYLCATVTYGKKVAYKIFKK